MMNNPFQQIPQTEIQFFKEKVQRWLHVDNQIEELKSRQVQYNIFIMRPI